MLLLLLCIIIIIFFFLKQRCSNKAVIGIDSARRGVQLNGRRRCDAAMGGDDGDEKEMEIIKLMQFDQ